MASALSPSAIQRIIFLVENNDRPTPRLFGYYYAERHLQQVSRKWKAIYELYTDMERAPPLDYLSSLELALVLKSEVDDADVRAIFAHGKPLTFSGYPPMLVSKIVETFGELKQEPEYLDMTITLLPGESRFGTSLFGARRPPEAWPQVYTTRLPCYACTTVKTVDKRSIPSRQHRDLEDPLGSADFVVEKFHVSSKRLAKQLTVELHYRLEEGKTETEREQSSWINKIAIQLTDKTCLAKAKVPSIAQRSSATLLLLPDFTSDVFGFLDRAHVGSSLVANRGLHDLIFQLRQRLPLHHLKCVLKREQLGRRGVLSYTDAYWLEVRHIQRDLSYTDLRRFKLPSPAGAEEDCALIRHYLGSSHVADLRVPEANDVDLFRFAMKMLASLAARNFSLGRVELCAESQRLSDYRSMDVVFGGMRMSKLHLICEEHRFVELVKTTDFFRMSSVQGLRELKLELCSPWTGEDVPRGPPRSKSPLWVSGICLLRKCEYYRVDYKTDRHLRLIERNVVRICENFERGEIIHTVEHFRLKADLSKGMNYAFNRDNLLVSGMKVEWAGRRNAFANIEWDVYRFRNSSTGGHLTACVGRTPSDPVKPILHIVRGEIFPDTSFADYVDD